MSYRRRHRWFRRLALGLAFASVVFAGRVSVAAAKVDEGSTGSGQAQVIPYLSHGMLTEADAQAAAAEAIHDPALTELFAAQAQKSSLNPYPHLSHWMAGSGRSQDAYGDTRELPEPFVAGVTDFPRAELPAVRPDDVADRFAHSDVVAQPERANEANWRIEWHDALPLGIGIIVLAVGLGLALGFLRRPRIAGL
jgi:hypothetical protein